MEKIIAAGEADHEAVRLQERAAVVAWLRDRASYYVGLEQHIDLHLAADAIQRGDHLGGDT